MRQRQNPREIRSLGNNGDIKFRNFFVELVFDININVLKRLEKEMK